MIGGDDDVYVGHFEVLACRFNPDGRSMVVMDKDKMCVGFLIPEQSDVPSQ